MTCNQRLDVHPTFLLGKNATASNSGCLEASCYKWGRGRPLDALARTGASGDLALVLKFKLELFDQFGQAPSGEWVVGFQRQPTGLR